MAKIIVLGSFANSLVTFRRVLLQDMVALGHEVIACAPNASSEVRETLINMGVSYYDINLDRTGMNPIKDIMTLFNIIRLLKKTKPDVFIGYTIKPVVYGSFAAHFAGVPSIFSLIEGLGYAFMSTGLKSKLINVIALCLYRVSLHFNRKVFFLNSDNLRLFQKKNLIRDDQFILLNGIGVDLEYFNNTTYPEKVSFLLVARLLRDKGICEYAQAARIIKQKYPEIKFRLVGYFDIDNPVSITQEELRSWIDSGVVEYLGLLSDVRPAYADASVYVLPSYHEGMPVTVMEAMAMARPIITTEAPGCRETVQEGKNGFLVPVKNVSSLVEAIEYFIQRPEQIKNMGQESRHIAVEKFDVYKTNEVIISNIGLV